jgi:hypothetical protein
VLITAGPTREALDPVRFISNHSSGKMGFAVAEAAAMAGALGTWLAIRFGAQAHGRFSPVFAVGAAVVGLVALALAERRVKPMWVLYGVAAAAIAVGALG